MLTKLLPVFFIFLFGSWNPGLNCTAGDWPQFLGPKRNGHAEGETILEKFPKNGPRVLWSRSVGDGFSGITIANGKAILFHRVGDKERVEAMNAVTGEVLWRVESPTGFASAFNPDKGPRCTPLISKGFVYTFGAQGRLQCLELATGERKWMRETHKDFRAPEGYFGAGSSPIMEDDKLIVNVGSRNGAGIVAFDSKTGKTIWKTTNEYASYSSPVAVTVEGIRHLVFVTRMKVVSLDPQTGKVRFEFPFGQRGPTVNAASPVVLDGHLFVTAHYRVGAVWAKMGKNKATIRWQDDRTLSSHYSTPIEYRGKLFGIDGQERVGKPVLRCLDPSRHRVLWEKEFHYGAMIRANDKMIFITTTGELILAKFDTKQYRELDRRKIFSTATRANPALSNGLLYARDTGTLKCLDLGIRR